MSGSSTTAPRKSVLWQSQQEHCIPVSTEIAVKQMTLGITDFMEIMGNGVPVFAASQFYNAGQKV